MSNNVNRPICVILHHEAGNNGFDSVNKYHRQKWNFKSLRGFYAGYTWFLDKRRGWIQAREEDETGAHTIGWNDKSVGICLQGDYSKEILLKDTKAILKTKVDEIRTRWNIPQTEVYGHKEKQLNKPTECPASLMDFVVEYRKGDKTIIQKQIIALSQKVVALLLKLLSLKK